MTTKEYVVYDFKKAGVVDGSALAFAQWITSSSQIIADTWSAFSDRDVSLASDGIRAVSFESAMENCDVTNAGCVVNVEEENLVSMWHLTQNDLHTIVAELLNHPDEFEIPERELTETEKAMVELFLQTLARSLGEGWPTKETIVCTPELLQLNPKRMRLFEARETTTSATLTITFQRGAVDVNWILPKEQAASLLEKIVNVRAVRKSNTRPDAIVERMPVEVVCQLGTTSVSMGNLAALSGGDVLRLNQKIDQPVVVMIDGDTYFHAWPGRVGRNQGIEIEKCV